MTEDGPFRPDEDLRVDKVGSPPADDETEVTITGTPGACPYQEGVRDLGTGLTRQRTHCAGDRSLRDTGNRRTGTRRKHTRTQGLMDP